MSEDLIGIGKATSALVEVLNKLIGPGAEEAGELFADRIRYFRWKNSLHIVEQAHKVLEAKGITPYSIPLKTLLPILEGASLECDDDNLKTKWINLVVNAASGERTNFRHVEILKQISPVDSLVLDTLYHPPECFFDEYHYLKTICIDDVLSYLVEHKGIRLKRLEIEESAYALKQIALLSSHSGKSLELSPTGQLFMQAVTFES